MSTSHKLAIIGAGASGTLLAVQALSRLENYEVYLFENCDDFGRGAAYGVDDPCFLLNVRANRMGAYSDQPAHFFEWMQTHEKIWRALHSDLAEVKYTADDFVPRMIYGAYLQWLLKEAGEKAKRRLHLISEGVANITPQGKQLVVNNIIADSVVLACGNSFSRQLTEPSERIFIAPYEQRFIDQDFSNLNHVLILGTGLSMIDTMQLLNTKNYKGIVTAISRRGLIPLSHPATSKPHQPIIKGVPQRVADLVLNVRNGMNAADWQDKIDSLRSVTEDIWQGLTPRQQKALSRIFPWWNVARHRIPDFMYDYLQDLKKQNRLNILKGGVAKILEKNNQVQIQLKDGNILEGDVLVMCAGFDYGAKNLQKLCPDIVLNTHWNGVLAPIENHKFRVSQNHNVFAIGPLLHGFYFESSAVHEIRAQAEKIIQEIAA